MVDIADNSSTLASLDMNAAGTAGSFSGQIETLGDHDWIRFDIAVGGVWMFFAHFQNAGSGYGDSLLTFRDGSGTILNTYDDRTPGFNSTTPAIALSAGTYFLEIEDLGNDNTGSYVISAMRDPATLQTGGVTTDDDSISAGQAGNFVADGGDDIIDLSALGNDAMGEQGNDTLVGNSLANRLFGGLGNDFILGQGGDDTIFGDAGDDFIVGGFGNDELFGGAGNDRLQGEFDNDTLRGGAGDDLLEGGDGGDFLYGGPGSDRLEGGAGQDFLDSDGGDTVMVGGEDGDFYTVDSASDQVIELPGDSGVDTVFATVSHTLADNVEALIFVGLSSQALNGTGNGLANTITGHGGANVLDGGSAGSDGVIDTLAGLLGNDTYVLGSGNDIVTDTGGIDTITSTKTRSLASYTGIENLKLLGSANINGSGTSAANVLTGNSGANKLYGGAGKDTYTGGGGGDRFIFKTAADSKVGSARDVIKDFSTSGTTERIDLSAFAGTFAFRGTGPFTSAGKEVSYKFVGKNTLVKIDLDADAGAEMEIMLIGHKVLTAGDFYL
ncbi:MAG: calcium-binding protein [Hyphomicrobiaceae bacterium]